MTRVEITVRPVGQAFACCGVVRYASSGRKIHETEPHPFGFDHTAYAAAKNWADDHGYVVTSESEEA